MPFCFYLHIFCSIKYFFRSVLHMCTALAQYGVQDSIQEGGKKIITGNFNSTFYTTPLSKVCTHAVVISRNMFSMTRICQSLNTCMWKWPQSMLNVSKPWWREEISWLSHVVAYYPSNQPASALHSHLCSTQKCSAPQPCHLDQKTSHPLKDINIIVGRHINEM